MWFEKKRLDWVIPPVEAQVRALELPEGKIDMVLDTDTFNEVDDQFALAYALLSPEHRFTTAVRPVRRMAWKRAIRKFSGCLAK